MSGGNSSFSKASAQAPGRAIAPGLDGQIARTGEEDEACLGKGPWGEEEGSCLALGGSKLRMQREQGQETLRGNTEKLLEKRLGRSWGCRRRGCPGQRCPVLTQGVRPWDRSGLCGAQAVLWLTAAAGRSHFACAGHQHPPLPRRPLLGHSGRERGHRQRCPGPGTAAGTAPACRDRAGTPSPAAPARLRGPCAGTRGAGDTATGTRSRER